MNSYAKYDDSQHFTYHYCLTGDCPYNYKTGETDHVKSTVTTYDDSQHWTKTTCSGCSWSSTGTKYAHSNWINNGITDKSNSPSYTHTTEYECGGCDYHKTETDSCTKSFSYYTKVANGHTPNYKCSVCGQSMGSGTKAVHTWGDVTTDDGRRTCSVCGYLEDHTHNYKYDETYSSNSTSHWINGKCEGCGRTTTKDTGSHGSSTTYDPQGLYETNYTHKTITKCPTCQYQISSKLNDCTEGTTDYYTWSSNEKCKKYNKCTLCKQAVTGSLVSHSVSYGSWSYYDANQHRKSGTCSNCKSTIYSYGNHSGSDFNYVATGNMHVKYDKCSSCGSSYGSGYGSSGHSYTDHYSAWTKTTTEHYRTGYCICGQSSTVDQGTHNFVQMGRYTCTVCSYVKTSSSPYPLEPLSNNVSSEVEKALHDADVVDNSISIESYVDNIETEALVAEDKLKHIILKTDPHEKE